MSSSLENKERKADPDSVDRRWSFGPVVLDERTLELTVSGARVELRRKPLEVLLHLLHHSGEVVTKDELLAAVWPGRILSDSALTSCIFNLREALADEEQNFIKTVHGYGYRLVAEVKVEFSPAPAPPRFDFKPGDHPPQRQQWSLVQRLGTGGHGEVWLAQHDKTREQRVYKFALDRTALTALKREITLSRLLHDSLGHDPGARPWFVEVLDWNLEEEPCFLEAEYSGEQSLVAWAEAQGGLEKVPLPARLEIVAQAAEALWAAHTVGVLHKDLKPSNVLILAQDGPPIVKLSDFGSGGVLDPARLEALGITRMGFTQAVIQDPATSGTLLYLAPEVIAGQPATVRADIYALGVMLYQLVVGDLKKPLASGWERDIEQELLREDIADAAVGNPAHRLTDANALAGRLRHLDARTKQRADDQARQAEAEQQRRAIERLRARRTWMITALAAMIIGLAASVALSVYALRARNEALAAAATTEAVSDFLNADLLSAASPYARTTQGVTIKDLLDRAASTVEQRFAGQPAAAAKVHYSLGSSYAGLGYADQARQELSLAVSQFEQLYGREADPTLLALRQLALPQITPPAEALTLILEVLNRWEPNLGSGHPRVMLTRRKLATLLYALGRYPESMQELRKVLEHCTHANPSDEGFHVCPFALWQLATDQAALAQFKEAETTARQCIRDYSEAVVKSAGLSNCHIVLGTALTEMGRYEDAEKEISIGLTGARQWGGDRGFVVSWLVPYSLGKLRFEQGRMQESLSILDAALAAHPTTHDLQDWNNTRIPYLMGEIYQRQGNLEKAAVTMRESLAAFEKIPGRNHPTGVKMHAGLADVLREQGKYEEASAVLNGISPEGLAALPPRHPILADLRREQGLLWQQQGKPEQARASLSEALDIYQLRYGPDHWRTKRSSEELSRGKSAGQQAVRP